MIEPDIEIGTSEAPHVEEEALERAFLRLVPGEAGGERERQHQLVMIEGLLRREAGLSEAEVVKTLDRANGWDEDAGSPEGAGPAAPAERAETRSGPGEAAVTARAR